VEEGGSERRRSLVVSARSDGTAGGKEEQDLYAGIRPFSLSSKKEEVHRSFATDLIGGEFGKNRLCLSWSTYCGRWEKRRGGWPTSCAQAFARGGVNARWEIIKKAVLFASPLIRRGASESSQFETEKKKSWNADERPIGVSERKRDAATLLTIRENKERWWRCPRGTAERVGAGG